MIPTHHKDKVFYMCKNGNIFKALINDINVLFPFTKTCIFPVFLFYGKNFKAKVQVVYQNELSKIDENNVK